MAKPRGRISIKKVNLYKCAMTNEIVYTGNYTPITSHRNHWVAEFSKRYMLWYCVRGNFKGFPSIYKRDVDKKIKALSGG